MKKFFTLITAVVLSAGAYAQSFVDLVVNGDFEGDDLSCFVSKDWSSGSQVWGPVRVIADPTNENNKCAVVTSREQPTDEEGNTVATEPWDCQFFITVPDNLKAGDEYRLTLKVRADKAATSSNQAHNQPGGYNYWDFCGAIPFTDAWETIERTGTISQEQAGTEMHTIALNLYETKDANNYYFDDIKWEVKKAPEEDYSTYTELITNGNCEGTETTNYISKEFNTGSQTMGPSRFVADPTDASNKCIEVVSRDQPTEEGAPTLEDWDTQFFITTDEKLEPGDKYRITFRVRAEKPANSQTQAHNQPGDYNFYVGIGDVAFTEGWVDIERTGTITEEQVPAGKEMHTIAFNLALKEETAEMREANKYYFDDISFLVLKANPADYSDYESIVQNGDFQGTELSNYYVHEYRDGEYFEGNARIVKDPKGASNKCVVVTSREQPEGEDAITDWDTQFFITAPDVKLEPGDEYFISFRIRAEKPATAQTQAHNTPGDYNYWEMLGDITISDSWVDIKKSGTITEAQVPEGKEMHTIAFNLAVLKEANKYYFDDIVFLLKKAPVTQLIGDANGDGTVTVADVTAVIDYVLAGSAPKFVYDNANVNGDDQISVADVTGIIAIVLGSGTE